MNQSGSSTMPKRTFSFRRAFASWREFSFMRLKPRSRQTHLGFERLEDRAVLTNFIPTVFADGPLGSGSLRDTVLQANADPGASTDTISLPFGTYTLSIANVNGQENNAVFGDLDVTSQKHDLIIQGGVNVAGFFDPTKTIIDASKLDRAFQIFFTHTNVTFKNLTIIGGLAQDDGIDGRLPGTSDALGGSILSNDGTVILDHVMIRNNAAQGGDGADGVNAPGGDGFHALGGGVYVAGGAVTLANSDIRQNMALGGNGGAGGTIGIQNPDTVAPHGGEGGGASGGGMFALRADVTVTTSNISRNSALGGAGGDGGNGNVLDVGIGGDGGSGGGAVGGGLHTAGGTANIVSSIIEKNTGKGGRGGEGGIGKSGGNGGPGGFVLGGGLFADDNDSLTLTDTDLLTNSALGGEGGQGHSGTASVPSGPDPNSGILGHGGNGGVGGAAWGGGGLYESNSQGSIMIDGGKVNGNTASGGHGGHGGHGADASPNFPLGGFGGNGGEGGLAQGGSLFIGADSPVDITSTEVSENYAKGGFGGAGGDGRDGDDDFAGGGGIGGAGGDSRGGGILFSLASGTPVNLTSSPVFSNHALGGGGGTGGFGGSADDDYARDGGAGGAGGTAQGGGIFLARRFEMGGSLTLTTLSLSKNDAIGGDGGKGRDGGDGDHGGQGGAGGAGGAGKGGGLFADAGTVTVLTSTLSTNKAKGGSSNGGGRGGKATDEDGPSGGGGGTGGAGQGGGLFATGAIIDITRSTVDHNEATGALGGKGGQGGKSTDDTGGNGGNGGTGGAGQGAGLYSLDSTTTLTNSTVSTNTAQGGKGGDGGKGGEGGDDDDDISGNGGNGGDSGKVQGGGIYVSEESLTTLSDTITANRVRPSTGGKGAQAGPGFGVGTSGTNGSGHKGTGGGVFNLDATVNSFNTLIAGNFAASAPDFAGLFNVAMFNLVGIGDGSSLAPANPDTQGNLVGSSAAPINPKLGALTNNGGPTKTHALLVGSPAINKGANLFSPGPTDQRGAGHDRIVGGTIDIGAFEFKGRAGTK